MVKNIDLQRMLQNYPDNIEIQFVKYHGFVELWVQDGTEMIVKFPLKDMSTFNIG